MTVYKPWLDDKDGFNVLFQSVHLHGKNFYPNTGGFPAISEADILKQTTYKPGGIYNYPIFPGSAKCSKWRKTFAEQMIPKLVAFNPDFILISAGFDAHMKDHIHLSTDTTITEFDYKWVTEQITKVANLCCQGRVVSVLEGGYSTKSGPISPLAQSIQMHVRTLLKSNLSKVPVVELGEGMVLNEFEYFKVCKEERSLLKKRVL